VHEGVERVAAAVTGGAQAAAEDGVVAVVELGAPGELAGEGIGQGMSKAGGASFITVRAAARATRGVSRARSGRFLARATGMVAKSASADLQFRKL
jgi:hypothetical protein